MTRVCTSEGDAHLVDYMQSRSEEPVIETGSGRRLTKNMQGIGRCEEGEGISNEGDVLIVQSGADNAESLGPKARGYIEREVRRR